MGLYTKVLQLRLREWIAFDSVLCASTARLAIGCTGIALFWLRSRRWSFRLMSAVHRSARPRYLCNVIERVVRRGLCAAPPGARAAFDGYFHERIETSLSRSQAVVAKDPLRMVRKLAMVVASATPGVRRGVIILNYNYTFPLFAREFDLPRIAERYHIVLEPSWSGYCTEDVLCYILLRPRTVFVQGYEERDGAFIDATGTNLINVPLSTNWWVDTRVFSPSPGVERDLDFVMAASWSEFKRHHRFFGALRTLRRNGHRLRGACVGYPAELTLNEIKRRAEWYGVADQCEFHEFVPPAEVARLMNRAKVNVIWSRKEGVNRAIIEGMFCDAPCLIPEGFNYGYRYPYINEQTGRFSSDANLPRDLLEMTRAPWPHSPSQWVRNHMTPQHSTAILSDAIRRHCAETGEEPPEELAVKVNELNRMKYWDPTVPPHFKGDYDFLLSQVRSDKP